jgi:hypothetical protein
MFDKDFFVFWSCVLIGVAVAVALFAYIITADNLVKNSYERGYVDACKDFYKGKLKYDLVSNPDGTREWKKVK